VGRVESTEKSISNEQVIIRYLGSKVDDLKVAVTAGYLKFEDSKYTVTEKGYGLLDLALRFTPKPKNILESIFK